MERQVRVEGRAEKLTTAEVLAYFLSRPTESQLWPGPHPKTNASARAQLLLQQFNASERKNSSRAPSRCRTFGAVTESPDRFEFWQGGANRLHDRFEYQRLDDAAASWQINRLAP